MTRGELVASRLREQVAGRVATDASLAPFTTYRVGGPADVLVTAERVEDVIAVGRLCGGQVPIAIVGRGSNLIVSDDGFRGVAVCLGRSFRTYDHTEDGFVFGGAMYLPSAAKLTAKHGWAGFEFAAEIPGTFGGGVRMNAGAHDRSMADVLVWADVVDVSSGELRRVDVVELDYGYRRSALRPNDVVVYGRVALQPDDPDEVAERIAGYLAWRREHQPGGRSAGSIFKNPPGDSAGRLIEAAGLKGHRIGRAEVSSVHANFFVADADALAEDLWRLIWHVRSVVRERFGVTLEPEVRFVGAFPQVEGHDEG